MEQIALKGLGADEVAEMISTAAGHELDRDGVVLAAEITAKTAGNPFFVGEILRSVHLRPRSHVARVAGRDT